jgi:ParB family transcriptional regulator, chromosome partitioning protein
LPLKALKRSTRAVREPTGDIDELVDSIREHGLLEPIVVRPVGDYLFEVVAGNRRLEACRRLNMKSVTCHVVAMDDATSYEESLIENIQRKNMNPMEEAIAFRRYVDDYGFGGVSQLARVIGKSKSYVSRRIALLDLPDMLMKSIADSHLSWAIAEELIPLAKADAASLGQLALNEKLSRDEIRSMIRAVRAASSETPVFREEKTPRLKKQLRVLSQATTILRICMMRLDATIDSLDQDDWMIREALVECRRETHLMQDRLIKMGVRSRRPNSSGLEGASFDT